MIAALETSRGKIEGSKMLWIGTRPASETHPFALALAGGVGYSQVHAARPDDPPHRRRTWTRANPALPFMPDLLAAIQRESARAKLDPSRMAAFKALRLNMGVSDIVERMLLPADLWSSIEGEADRSGPYILGLDLGGSVAMSAASAYWVNTGRLESVAAFPAHPNLAERGLQDAVGPLYSECARRGELIIAGHRVVDIPVLLGEALDRWGKPAAIVADRYRITELRQVLESINFPAADLVARGMGFR